MTTRSQLQPNNLKERIAALEQRNANLSPADRPLSPLIPFTPSTVPNSTGLRDKIAKFEKKGGVPVPRGSFGLGAPPLAENAPLKRRGELYGNRIPGVRAVTGTSVNRAGSSADAGRVVSMPNLDGVYNGEADGEYLPSSPSSTSSPSPPFTRLTPQHTGSTGLITPQFTGSALTSQCTGSRDSGRTTSFATALELARKAETEGQTGASMRPASVAREASPAPTSASDQEEKLANTTFASAPSFVPNNQEKGNVASGRSQEVSSPPETAVSSDEPAPVPEPISPPQPSTPSIVLSTSDKPVTGAVAPAPGQIPGPGAHEPVKADAVAPASSSTIISPIVTPAPATTTIIESGPNFVEPANDKPSAASQNRVEGVPSPATTDENPLSPLGPFSLANAVHDLGKVVANIQDMFPGQISPLAAPPPHRPLVIDTPSTSKEQKTPLKNKKSISDLELKFSTSSEASLTVPRRTMHVPATSSVTKPTESLISPRNGNARPVSMSPSQVAVVTHVTPTTSHGATSFVNGSQKPGAPANKYEHFPPTPVTEVSEFVTVSLGHKTSHSLSQARSSMDQDTGTGSFSAVVHKKVTELPSSTTTSSSYLSFYTKVPDVPKKSSEPEPVTSPGYGELATLLHETALLEFSLEQGELPGEAAKKTELEQKENGRQKSNKEEEEREKSVAARSQVGEEKKKHTTMAKVHTKQEPSERKSKSAFRNALSRGKSTQKQDELTKGEVRKEPARSKSVLLPFRPLPEPPSHQSIHTPLAITPIPEKDVVSPTHAASETESKSPTHTSPKSLRYFTGLKRFASSKASLTSASQPRNSVSASSEMSSDDSSGIPTPPGNGGETESKGGLFNGTGIAWPSLSPKKSSGVGRSASFTDKIFNRNRKTSTVSSMSDENSAYEAIDRLAQSRAGKSAASLIPPLDPVSLMLDVPMIQNNDQPLSSPLELASPRRSASLYVPSTSQFPPVLSARPTSSFYTPILQSSETRTSPHALDSVNKDKLASPNFTSPAGPPQQSVDAIFSAKPTSPVYTPYLSSTFDIGVPAQTPSTKTTHKQPQNLDATLFSVKPTSPVYTPHAPALAMRSEETITDSPTLPPNSRKETESPRSWTSVDSFPSSIPSPLFDSFPSVPEETPLPPALSSRQRNFNKPSLPLPASSSFFETAPPLSSAVVGTEFFVGSGPFVKSGTIKSATLPQASGKHYR